MLEGHTVSHLRAALSFGSQLICCIKPRQDRRRGAERDRFACDPAKVLSAASDRLSGSSRRLALHRRLLRHRKARRGDMVAIAAEMVAGLHWADIESWSISFLAAQAGSGSHALAATRPIPTLSWSSRPLESGLEPGFGFHHQGDSKVHVWAGPHLADAAVKAGLFDWLVERSS